MKLLFIGGTGTISSACSQLAIERGHELYLLNRGQTTKRPVPEGARVLHGDIRDSDSARAALGTHTFDAVVDWIAFTTDHVETDLDLFRAARAVRLHQFGVGLSDAAGQRACHRIDAARQSRVAVFAQQDRLRGTAAARLPREKFPMTVVRPSHTYDKTLNPIHGGYTMIARMRKGQPVIVHGDGTRCGR